MRRAIGLVRNPGLKLVSVAIALFLWMVAQGTTSIERGLDIPVVVKGVPEQLVVTDQSADVVNVRVSGSRAALRNLDERKLEYAIDAVGAQVGAADFEVDLTRFDFPRAAKLMSRSPAQIELTFEPRLTKTVRVEADVAGEPAPGFALGERRVNPQRVRITGAQSDVRRLESVMTETIDVSNARESFEREVRVDPGQGHVWVDGPTTVRARVEILERPPEGAAAPQAADRPGTGRPGSGRRG